MSLKSRIQHLEPTGGVRCKVVSPVPYGEKHTGQREALMTAEEWERTYGGCAGAEVHDVPEIEN
jgi:hypothetical protein